ncbi:MAG: 3-deoxy-manno-octulosonate cytidylyltransferase [Bacteroidetes bacterium]|nr:3-deoxy-manno-octulosonate cytidylyltransferase [Bacteroidota bacterium]MBL6963717.1 3-deoxy-manno-octulosonate cytidylyltransferase [Bacteroidota bacterium]
MKVIAIIPARYHSSRFPGKPLAMIGDKSMIRRVFERVKLSGVTEAIIATDDDRILKHAENFGAKVILTSSKHKTGTERCAEAYEKNGAAYEVVINVQGDEPFIDPAQIKLLSKTFEDQQIQIASLMEKITKLEELEDPNTIKIAVDHQNFALYFSRSVIPFMRDKTKKNWLKDKAYWKHIGIYAFRSSVLKEIVKLQSIQIEAAESLEQLRWLYYGYRIKLLESSFGGISVDTPEDLEQANLILNNTYI